MARNEVVATSNKRKLANGSSVKNKSSSKKTKFEKPSPSEESESVSDEGSDVGAFSDDNEDGGGAQLHPDRVAKVQGDDQSAAKDSEKGGLIATAQ